MSRWAWRMLRREWRSQVLVTLLLFVTVVVAVCGGTTLYNVPRPADPRLGTAGAVYELDGQGRAGAMAADLDSLRRAFGTIDVIGHTPYRVPGLTEPVDYRAQAPHGAFTGQLLGIHRGRYPSGPGEAAVTAGVAKLLGLRLGGTIALDGHPRTIVGIAENPSDLADDFVLTAPSAGAPPRTESVFTRGSERGLESLHLSTVGQVAGQGPNTDHLVITTLVLGGATVLLLLVAFVAAAGFAVLAHRRLRQLGMLAAVGATGRHVRLTMAVTGLLVGGLAATAGTAAGLALWPAAASWLEPAVGHRIDRLDIPWPLIAAIMLLTVLMSTGSAWWPARAMSRLPVTQALSGRPPAPRPSHRPLLIAVLLLVAGLGFLAAGGKKHPPLIIAGTAATALAMLFAGPPAIKLLAAASSRAPVAMRLALRDLGRHQARSGAALAAISLALGIAAAIVVVTTGIQGSPAAGNLSDRQLLVRVARAGDPASLLPIRTDAELGALAGQVDQIAASLGQPAVIPLDMAYDPAAPPELGLQSSEPVHHAAELGIPRGEGGYSGLMAYVATPALLRLIGVDAAEVPPSTEVITTRSGSPVLIGNSRDLRQPPTAQLGRSSFTSLPDTLLTPAALGREHLVPIRAGWLLESDRPLTDQQRADARRLAAAAGLTVELRDGHRGVRTVRTGATAGGLLLALAVLAMTVGLIRGESAADLRTLTATGASAGIRRTLTAATAGGLALLGGVLGAACAGLGLVAVYRHDLSVFGRIPPIYPAVLLVGVPLVATAAGWLLAGREPAALARRMPD
jgi:putative ABC transport system permease protein